jgi:hypothetical protein
MHILRNNSYINSKIPKWLLTVVQISENGSIGLDSLQTRAVIITSSTRHLAAKFGTPPPTPHPHHHPPPSTNNQTY